MTVSGGLTTFCHFSGRFKVFLFLCFECASRLVFPGGRFPGKDESFFPTSAPKIRHHKTIKLFELVDGGRGVRLEKRPLVSRPSQGMGSF